MAEFDNPRPTSQPVGSTDLAVAKDNLIVLDNMINAEAGAEITNRKGETITPLVEVASDAATVFAGQLEAQQESFDTQTDTNQSSFDTQLEGQQSAFDNQSDTNQSAFESQLASIGYQVIGNFTDGCEATTLSSAVYYSGNALNSNANEGFYAWNGTFPKTVIAGSTPFDETGWLLAATGYVKQSGAIQFFGQTIDVDIAIPSGQNALSINPTISEGVTVTVPEGSEYIILGSTL